MRGIDTWGSTYAGSLYSSAILYMCKNFFTERMAYYLFVARFKQYIVLIFCGSSWTLVCMCWQVDIWNVFLSTCIFTYDAVDELFVYSLCLYDLNLSPVSWTLYCYSFFKILSLCIYYLMFLHLCFPVLVFYILDFYIVIHKTRKKSFISEVLEPYFFIV